MKWSLAAALLTLASVASADIPQPPPADCPRGAIAIGTRSASYCRPTECASCADDQRCSPEPMGLCVVRTTVVVPAPPGIGGPPAEESIVHAVGACDARGRCAQAEATCERAPRCIAAADPALDGMCGAAPGSRAPLPWLALLALTLLLMRSRAPRSLLALALLACDPPATVPDASADAGRFDAATTRDAGTRDAGPPVDPLAGRAELTLVADGFMFTEGPQWRDGVLYFTDIPASTIYALTPPRDVDVFRAPSGEANGLAVLPDGRLLAAEHSNRRVSVTSPDAIVTTFVERYDGARFHSPNDLAVHSDGTVYFTDPPYGLRDAPELAFVGVFRVREGDTSTVWEGPLGATPNGIALSPDERVLYVAYTEEALVRAFDVDADGATSAERVFATGTPNADGIAIDEDGNVYVASSDGIVVFAPDGARWGTIPTEQTPTNCTFGGDDLHTLYVTAGTALYETRLAVRGIP